MIDIAQHIEYLLMHHDCVVVPGFGAFMLNRESAYYDHETGLYMPPSCSLGFNRDVRHNDALLVGSISRREGITIDAARGLLESSIVALRHQLQLCGEVGIGNLGLMTFDAATECYIFKPAESSLPTRAYDCLQPLAVAPFESEKEDALVNVNAESRQPVVVPFPLKVVASIIAVIVGLGILYSTTSLVNNSKANFASLDTGISVQLGRVIDSTVAVSREILLNIAVPPHSELAESENTSVEPSVVKDEPIQRYILVVGSFPTSRAADRYVDESSDKDLRIVEMDGNFRVYAASSSNIDDARRLAASLADRYPNVWVCRQ